jgi:hypothetical protein
MFSTSVQLLFDWHALLFQSSLKLKKNLRGFGCTKSSPTPRHRKVRIANSVTHSVAQNISASLTF